MFLWIIVLSTGLYCCPLVLSLCNPGSAVRKTGFHGKPFSKLRVKNEVHCYKLCSYSKVCKAYNYIHLENESECQLLSSVENDFMSSELTASYVLLTDTACTPFANTNPCDSKPCGLLEICILIDSGKKYMCMKNVKECGEPSLETGMFIKSLAKPAIAQTTAIYDCEIGYIRQSGSGISTCNTNGEWTPLNLKCKEIDCGNLTLNEGVAMKVLPSPARYNSTATYECKNDYRYINGSRSTTCGVDGRWGEVDLKCEKIHCDTPSDIWQISNSTMGALTAAPYNLGAVQPYACIENYNLTSGDGRSVCLSNSTWSRPDMECQPIVCGDLPTKKFAIPGDVPQLPYIGTSVTFTCNQSVSNYVGGAVNITCLSSKKWSQLEINCIRRCDEFPKVENAVPSMFYTHSTLGCTVNYSCIPDYVASGDKISTCTDNGWSQPGLSCVTGNAGCGKEYLRSLWFSCICLLLAFICGK